MARMTREEYISRGEREDDWSPGWDAIDECLQPLYGDQKPIHLGSPFEKRAILGGDQYIDGCSIYSSPKGYKHAVTYGMTELYKDLDSLGKEVSGWGYEMTVKYWTPSGVSDQDMAFWSGNLLAEIGNWANRTRTRFRSMLRLNLGNGKSFNHHVKDSAITAMLLVHDTELAGVDTVHGRVEFLQLVGITQNELKAIKDDVSKTTLLVERMKADNPDLVTDFSRKDDYL